MNKLEELTKILRMELHSGKFQEGSRFPSEYDLACQYDVNKTTANKAVGLLVAEGFLERGNLRHKGTLVRTLNPAPKGKIAFMTANDGFFARIVNGALDMAFSQNYLISIFQPTADHIGENIRRIRDYHFDGILANYYDVLPSDLGIPVVYAEKCNLKERNDLNQVKSLEEEGAYKLCREVLSFGHREIVVFSGNINDHELSPRYRGIRRCLEDAGIPDISSRLFHILGDHPGRVKEVICGNVLRQYPNTTAIMALTDTLAFQAYHVLNVMKIAVPEQISITGYGNLTFGHPDFTFTTVDQHPYDIGVRACKKLIDIIEKKEVIPVEYIPTTLIRGNSLSYIKEQKSKRS